MPIQSLTKDEPYPLISEMNGGIGLHPQEVVTWRKAKFLDMGFSESEAWALTNTRIDLHDMAKLLKEGCSHETAWQILTGTMWSGPDPLWREGQQGGYMDVEDLVDSEVELSEEDGA